MKILSIDAMAYDDSWQWNSWHIIGNIDKAEFEAMTTDEQYIRWFYEQGYTTGVIGCHIEDDGYNVIICDSSDDMPIFAIEYGPEY